MVGSNSIWCVSDTKCEYISLIGIQMLVSRIVRTSLVWIQINYNFIIISRLNSSFSPLTFPKLWFWHFKKKLQNRPLSFATVAVLASKAKKKHVAPHLGCHVSVGRVKIGIGAKTSTYTKLKGQFCSFF